MKNPMKRGMDVLAAAVLFSSVAAGTSQAALILFSDKTDFLAETGASDATGPGLLPDLGSVGLAPVVLGDVTLQSASGNSLFVGTSGSAVVNDDWTLRLPGPDIAISGFEHLDVSVNLASPAFSFGFDFVEPELDPNVNAAFAESTFTVTLLSGGMFVDSFLFSRPNDSAEFVGVWSTAAFDGIEIRETTGGIENEFFGEFYAGTQRVPEPASILLLVLGSVGIAARHRRDRA